MFYKHEENGVVIYKSSLLGGIPHGFSTRLGGVSREAHLSSMNLGFGQTDGETAVRENRRRFASACGIAEEDFTADIFTSANDQIHSDRIEYVTEKTSSNDFVCDGFYTDRHGVAVAVKTADCVPILLASADGRAVAAVHAGWRGTAAGIAAHAVDRLVSLGVKKGDIIVAVGPSISPERYRVGDDFSELLYSVMSKSASDAVRSEAKALSRDFIRPYSDGVHCDLWALNRAIMELSGVMAENIDTSGICTFDNCEYFYSHRRQGTERGIMASLISPGW